MLFHEKTRDKPITVERLDDMLIDEKNDKIQELEEENKVLMEKIEELEKTLNDIKVNLPLIRMKSEAFAYKIQILKPSGKYKDFITVVKKHGSKLGWIRRPTISCIVFSCCINSRCHRITIALDVYFRFS